LTYFVIITNVAYLHSYVTQKKKKKKEPAAAGGGSPS